MELLPDHFETAEESPSRRFVVNLQVREKEAPQVRSCEVVSRTYRNRTTFQGVCDVEDVFEENVANGLRECLNKLSLDAEVVSLPDFFIETPGLILAGAHMMSSIAPDGMVAIILRFQLMIGGVACAFKSDIGVEKPLLNSKERIATLILSDISLPLLDICAAAETDLMSDANRLNNFAKKLAERSHEIRFQVELVKRYIAGMDQLELRNADGTVARDVEPALLSVS